MKSLALVLLLAPCFLASPLAAEAAGGKIPRVGFLVMARNSGWRPAFRAGCVTVATWRDAI
jgi:ABC-type sugar transport system substrate-binding protein